MTFGGSKACVYNGGGIMCQIGRIDILRVLHGTRDVRDLNEISSVILNDAIYSNNVTGFHTKRQKYEKKHT